MTSVAAVTPTDAALSDDAAAAAAKRKHDNPQQKAVGAARSEGANITGTLDVARTLATVTKDTRKLKKYKEAAKTAAKRVHDLEARIRQLESDVAKERSAKKARDEAFDTLVALREAVRANLNDTLQAIDDTFPAGDKPKRPPVTGSARPKKRARDDSSSDDDDDSDSDDDSNDDDSDDSDSDSDDSDDSD